MAPREVPVPEVVFAELSRILASPPFANAARSQQFLRHVVEHSLRHDEDALKEYTIAVEVFDRDASYDPSIDATVRVEAGRLRSRLRDYYAGPGKGDPLLIEVPKGGYHATFSTQTVVAPAPEPIHVDAEVVPLVAAARPKPGLSFRNWRWAALAAVLLAMLPVSFWAYRRTNPNRTAAPDQAIVLAILPFANQTGDPRNDYLTEGLTDNLIRQMAELHQIRVVSRAAVGNLNQQAAVKELGATALLAGQLQRNAAGRLVLNSELSSAREGTVLRSSQFYPEASDLRPVQADIVQDIMQGLAIRMDSAASALAQRQLTTSPAAYGDFLRGETDMENGDEASLIEASQLFEGAVEKDRNFAQAYSSLAEAHLELGMYFEPPFDHFKVAGSAARQALAIDPAMSDPHGVLGLIHLVYDWDYSAAQVELAAAERREVAIWHLGCTAHLLDSTGNLRHAEEDLQHMLEFSPGASNLVAELGCVKYYGKRYEESVQFYQQALRSDPHSVLAAWGYGRTLGAMGRYKEALAELEQYVATYKIEHPLILGEIGYIQALAGNRQGAMETMEKLKLRSHKTFIDPYFVAIIYLGLNDSKATYEWLNKAYDIRSPFLISIATDPKWSSSQADPRLQALWNRMATQKHQDEQSSGSM